MGAFEAFARAGRTLADHRLVRRSEGNLSTFDGRRLTITRTGCELGALVPDDVQEGTLDAPPANASSDLAIHVTTYRERGAGAIAHAHPHGTVPPGWTEGEPHGVTTFGASLDEAVATIVGSYGSPGR